jgi:hypothetical protein
MLPFAQRIQDDVPLVQDIDDAVNSARVTSTRLSNGRGTRRAFGILRRDGCRFATAVIVQ